MPDMTCAKTRPLYYTDLDFDYTFEHVAGKENIADAASRIGEKRDDPQFGSVRESHELCMVETEINSISEDLLAETAKQVQEEQLKNKELQAVIQWLAKEQRWPDEIVRFQPLKRDMYVQDGALMKQEKLVLPSVLRKRALSLAHRSHPGMSTMKNCLRQGWPNMDREVEIFFKCPECQLVKGDSHPPPNTFTAMPANPWDYVSMDLSSASDALHWKALVLTDNYSRFLVAVPMERTDTEAVKKVNRRIFNTYYVPKTLKMDNGPPFNSSELQTWLREVEVKLIHCTPLNPTENGLVERNMQGLNKIAAIAKVGKLNWKEALADYVAAYNSWPRHVTKIPPAELMFGRAAKYEGEDVGS
uniref:Integrase catalytic domain-containing protein n=1 Tax=Anopheles funestus TaxID=62324 RepID=A0A182S0A3_ANOFN